jgi:hypothetical protein
MLSPRICCVFLGICVLPIFCRQSVASEIPLQSEIKVHFHNCQTDLEKTICTLAERLDALRVKQPYWNGPLETDPTCDAVLLVLAQRLGKSSSVLLEETLERIFTWEGRTKDGWATYPGGPYDHNTTAIILLSLQAVGIGRDNAELKEAWKSFEKMGGMDRLTVTSRIFLDALGLFRNDTSPLISPKS